MRWKRGIDSRDRSMMKKSIKNRKLKSHGKGINAYMEKQKGVGEKRCRHCTDTMLKSHLKRYVD